MMFARVVALSRLSSRNMNKCRSLHRVALTRSRAPLTVPTMRRFSTANVDDLMNQGVLHLQQGRFDDAIASFDRILDVDQDNVRAVLNRAIALHNAGRRDEAAPIWKHLLENAEDDARVRAMCYFHMGESSIEHDRAEALKLLQKAFDELDSSTAVDQATDSMIRGRLHCARGVALAMDGDEKGAVESWTRGTQVSPSSKDNFLSLAHHFHNKQDWSMARQWYERLMELSPPVRAYGDYASCLAALHDLSALRVLYKQAIDLCQHDGIAEAPVHYRFGVAFANVPDAHDDALKAYDESEKTSPVIKADENDEESEKKLSSGPIPLGSPRWFAMLCTARGVVLASKGGEENYEKALEEYEKSLNHFMTLDALMNKGVLNIQMGNLDTGKEAFAAAYTLDPEATKHELERLQEFIEAQEGDGDNDKKE